MDQDTKNLLLSIIKDWDGDLSVKNIDTITPDASARRYYRLHLNENSLSLESVVAMVFDSVKPAEVGSLEVVNSDLAYKILTEYFLSNQVAVPDLYFEKGKIFLIEDLGERILGNLLIEGGLSNDDLLFYYKSSIDEIIKLQNLDIDKKVFAFNRSFTAEIYKSEMREFVDYYLVDLDFSSNELELVDTFFDHLVSELLNLELVLSHRDFHSWNLVVQEQGIRVIDFQDALMATRYYDLISLLNDRDTDLALGTENYKILTDYFKSKIKDDANFSSHYSMVLLQRDLKVVGRFAKLVLNGKPAYSKWISGTLKRIGLSLSRIKDLDQSFSSVLNLFSEKIDDIKQGSKNPDNFFI